MKCAKRLKKIRYPRFNLEAIIDKAQENLNKQVDEYIFDQFLKEIKHAIRHNHNIKLASIPIEKIQEAVLTGKFELAKDPNGRVKGYLDGVPVYVV